MSIYQATYKITIDTSPENWLGEYTSASMVDALPTQEVTVDLARVNGKPPSAEVVAVMAAEQFVHVTAVHYTGDPRFPFETVEQHGQMFFRGLALALLPSGKHWGSYQHLTLGRVLLARDDGTCWLREAEGKQVSLRSFLREHGTQGAHRIIRSPSIQFNCAELDARRTDPFAGIKFCDELGSFVPNRRLGS